MSEADKNQSILDDVSTSFKSLITERFTSPFLFSFVVAWLIFNHKLLILSFSDATEEFPISKKFELFDSILGSSYIELPFSDITLLLNGFLFPLVSAAFYTFLYPFADYYITKFTLERKVQLRNLRLQKERETFYTFEDVQKIYSKNLEDEKRWRSRLEQAEFVDAYKDTVIKELQSKVDSLNKVTENTALTLQDENNKKLSLVETHIQNNNWNDALEIVNEVLTMGTSSQKRRAKSLMSKLETHKNKDNELKTTSDNKRLSASEELVVERLGTAANNLVDWIPESTLFKLGAFSPVEVKIAIDELYRRNLIKREFKNAYGEFCLQLTVDGLKLYKIPVK